MATHQLKGFPKTQKTNETGLAHGRAPYTGSLTLLTFFFFDGTKHPWRCSFLWPEKKYTHSALLSANALPQIFFFLFSFFDKCIASNLRPCIACLYSNCWQTFIIFTV